MTLEFATIILLFALYSFYGWVCEVIYCLLVDGRYMRRGFLHGPYCPIYGFGALIALGISSSLSRGPISVFAITVVTAGLLEYAAGAFFERFFRLRLWDYSDRKFNIKGRVCLFNTLLFGILGVLTVYLAHPATMIMVAAIPVWWQNALGATMAVIFTTDFLKSATVAADLNERLRELRQCMGELKVYHEKDAHPDGEYLALGMERLRNICEENSDNADALLLHKRLHSITKLKNRSDRLIKNYPTLKPASFAEELKALRDNLEGRSQM